jgi:ACS family hexuronate transporter-like MFS transporter
MAAASTPSERAGVPGGNLAGGNYRWVICGLLFCSVAVNYIDRLVVGILK